MLQMSAVQFESKHLDPCYNLDRIEAWVIEEARQGADLIVFPELTTTGYLEPATSDDDYDPKVTGDATRAEFMSRFVNLAEEIPGPTTERLMKLARKEQTTIVIGMPEARSDMRGLISNSLVVIDPQGVQAVQRKIHLPWNERHVFVPGTSLALASVGGVSVGLNVCYDAYFPELSRLLALRGAELIISCFAGPRPIEDENNEQIPYDRASFLSRTRALENNLYFLSLNKVGRQGKYQFIGNSAISDPRGVLAAWTESTDETAIRTIINTRIVYESRLGLTPLRDLRSEMYQAL